MLLKQKRPNYDPEQQGGGDFAPAADPLFEREWEVLVIKRDEQTGEFEVRTVSLDEAAAA